METPRISLSRVRRQEISLLLLEHISAANYYRINPQAWIYEIWSEKRLDDLLDIEPTPQKRYDRFVLLHVIRGQSASPTYPLDTYIETFQKSKGICKLMKAIADGYEEMEIEWIQIAGHERQYYEDSNTSTT